MQPAIPVDVSNEVRSLCGIAAGESFALTCDDGRSSSVPNLGVSDLFSGRRFLISDGVGVEELDGRYPKFALTDSHKKGRCAVAHILTHDAHNVSFLDALPETFKTTTRK